MTKICVIAYHIFQPPEPVVPCRKFERRDVEPTSKTFDGLVLPEVSVTRRTVLPRRRESDVEFERTKLLQRLSRLTGSVLVRVAGWGSRDFRTSGFIVRIDDSRGPGVVDS